MEFFEVIENEEVSADLPKDRWRRKRSIVSWMQPCARLRPETPGLPSSLSYPIASCCPSFPWPSRPAPVLSRMPPWLSLFWRILKKRTFPSIMPPFLPCISSSRPGPWAGQLLVHMRGNAYNEQQSTHEYLSGLLHIPRHLEALCIIAIGYPDEEKAPYRGDELPAGAVHWGKY